VASYASAKAAHGGILIQAVAVRNDDGDGHAGPRTCIAQGLTMIAAGRGDDTAHMRALPPQAIHVDEPATHLEGAGGSVVLVLDPDCSADPAGEQRRGILCRYGAMGVDHGLALLHL